MLDISSLVVAAILLAQFVIAQHIGIRTIHSLREAAGVGATIILATLIATIIDWLVLHSVLQPFDIVYLHLFISVVFTAAIAPLAETLLRLRFAQWFPQIGNLTPLGTTTCCTIIAVQTTQITHASLPQSISSAIGLAFGATFLLIVLQTLREHACSTKYPAINLVARDLMNSAFILIALCGVLSIWR